MPGQILYMKCDANVEINCEDVYLKDVASLQCADEQILAKCKCIKVWHFPIHGSRQGSEGAAGGKHSDGGGSAGVGKGGGGKSAGKRQDSEGIIGRSNIQKRVVVSALKLVSLVEKTCPGVQVELIGETDVVIEYTPIKKQGAGQWLKIVIVCLISFFGTAFTIMAYHNDVGIRDVFAEVYRIVTHREAQGINSLEISYSIGLAAGILIFFNHVGNLKLTKDPTPIEVSMKNYEKDVNKTLVEVAERNGEEIDV